MIFDRYPYTNFHEMNDDWIIRVLKEMDARLDEFVSMNSLTYADPIEYDPDTIYPANTVLIYNGVAYVTKKTAPAGVLPTNDEYYLEVFPFVTLIEDLQAASAAHLETEINDAIPVVVDTWLNNHPTIISTVTPGSISFDKLHSGLQDIVLAEYVTDDENAQTIDNSNFTQGDISYLSGEESASNNTCRTGFLQFSDKIIRFAALGGYTVTFYEYDSDERFLNTFYIAPGGYVSAFLARSENRYRITVTNLNDNMTPSDMPIGAVLYQEYYPDRSDLTLCTACEQIKFTSGYIKTVTAGNAVNLTVLSDNTTVCAAVPCIAGEIFNISGLPFNISTKRPIMFVDSNNVCVQALVQSQVFTEDVVAPASGTLVINLSNSSEYYAYRNKIRLAQWVQSAVNGLSGMIAHNYLRQLATGSSESNMAYSLPNTNGAAQNNYTTDSYSVSPGEILIASGIVPTSLSYYFAFFYDADGKFIGYHNRKNGQTVYVDEPIICPPNCATVKFTHVTSNVTRVYRIYTDISTRKRVTREGDLIKICDGTYTFWMSKHGNNNLMDLEYIRIGNTNLHTTGTDWQGPYVVAANQNADGDAIAQGATYTGGNHAYGAGGASGTPTARTVSFKVIVDGVELEDGGDLDWNDYVELSWVNRVQAWNTKKSDGSGREVLEENPVWTFRPHGEVRVQNTVKALESITVATYYGMQMTAAWVSRGLFIPDATRKIDSVSHIYNTYGSSFDGSVISAYDSDINIGMSIDTSFDLGDGSCLGALKRIHISASKVYFRTIDNTQFAANDYFSYRGCYTFIKP